MCACVSDFYCYFSGGERLYCWRIVTVTYDRKNAIKYVIYVENIKEEQLAVLLT